MKGDLQRIIGETILVFLKPSVKPSLIKGNRGTYWRGSGSLFFSAQIVTEHSPAVFVVVAVNAQIFPIRTVGGIIPGISILVVYRQEMPILMIELPGTFGADEPVNLK